MKNILYIFLAIFILSACRNDDNEKTSTEYVGKWYLKKIISSNNGNIQTLDTAGTCAAKSYFQIDNNGKVTQVNYSDLNNCDKSDTYTGTYNNESKIIQMDSSYNLSDNKYVVEFVANSMNLKQTTILQGQTLIVTLVTEK